MNLRPRYLFVLAALGLGAPLIACSSDTATIAAPSSTVSATTIAPSIPTTTTLADRAEQLGDTAELVSLLTAEVEQWMVATGAPGLTLAAILPDQREISLAFGSADLRAGTPATPGDYWRFGSITKPMTSAVLLILAEQGLVDLNDPVANYLGADWATGYVSDGVDYGPLLTVRQLLNHTNGFAEYAFDPGFFILASSRFDEPFTPAEVVRWAVERGPLYTPGTSYQYNTVGHVAAGLVIEAVTGLPAHQVFKDLLFVPVGATEIYLPPAEFPPQMVTSGYVSGELRLAFSFLPALAPFLADATFEDFLDVTVLPQAVLTSAPFTGGGIEAQGIEVARVLRALFSGELLNDTSLREFSTLVPGQNYGLGINLSDIDGVQVFSHGGGVPGFRSHALTIPELGLTVALSTNLVPVDPDIGVLADALLAVLRTHL
jgi:D-alanyl-D-alanine carboxypeptidase